MREEGKTACERRKCLDKDFDVGEICAKLYYL